MSLPSIKDLELITNLITQVDTLKEKVGSLEEELEITKAEYTAKEESEYNKILQTTKDFINLENIQKEINQIRSEEADLRQAIEAKVGATVEAYFSSNSIKEFQDALLAKLKEKNSSVEVVQGEGKLRYVIGKKTYILDTEELKSELKVKLINELVPTE